MKQLCILLLVTTSIYYCSAQHQIFTTEPPVDNFAPAKIYFPRAGANVPDVALNFNYYVTNNPIDHLGANFNNIPNTKGSRYIFNNWAKGSVVTSNSAVIANDSIFFNIDKLKNSLLLRRSDGIIIEVEKQQINSFSLAENDQTLNFERVILIDPNQYLRVIAKNDNGYAAYKSITTTFKKSDYNTDGLMQNGNAYDEYQDSYKYYLVMPDKTYKIISLKLRSIKDAFAGNAKANDYFSSHKNDSVNETYLKNFIDFINE